MAIAKDVDANQYTHAAVTTVEDTMVVDIQTDML